MVFSSSDPCGWARESEGRRVGDGELKRQGIFMAAPGNHNIRFVLRGYGLHPRRAPGSHRGCLPAAFHRAGHHASRLPPQTQGAVSWASLKGLPGQLLAWSPSKEERSPLHLEQGVGRLSRRQVGTGGSWVMKLSSIRNGTKGSWVGWEASTTVARCHRLDVLLNSHAACPSYVVFSITI